MSAICMTKAVLLSLLDPWRGIGNRTFDHALCSEVLYRLSIGNLSTRRSWYHGRQPEVFLQHDSHCACQDVLELRLRTSKREFSGWNQRFQFCVLRRVKFSVWNYVFFVRKKQNLTQIFERHFQLNYSVGVRDGFTLFCLMICIWHANRVPDPVLRGQLCRSWIKNVRCLNSLISCIGDFVEVFINRLFDNLERGRKNYGVLLCAHSGKVLNFACKNLYERFE